MILRRESACFLLGFLLLAGSGAAPLRAAPLVTNVAQFQKLSPASFAAGCDVQLTGVITLVNTNRSLIVLQDATGAVALNSPAEFAFKAGDEVTLMGAS